RVNATGMPRRQTKFFEKLCIALCFALPATLLWLEWQAITTWLFSSDRWLPAGARWFTAYSVFCVLSGIVLGAFWIESRFWLIPPRHLVRVEAQRYDVDRLGPGGTPADRLTGFLNRLPGNQIGQLEVTRKQLVVPRAVAGLDGFKIGHISDLHFTGQY